MAFGNMTPAVPGGVASSAANNQIITNVDNLDTRLDVTEALTTNTTTNGGQGNARLADRLGTGVGTGSNVTTGSATSQLTDVRARLVTLETAPAPTSGPLGFKGEVKRTSVDSVTTDTILEVATVSLSANRRYRAIWDFNYDTPTGVGANFPFFRIRVSAAGGSVTTSSTVIAAKNVNTVAVQTPCTIIGTFTVATNNTYQVGTSASRAGTNPVAIRYAVNDTTRLLLIEDIGPV